MASGASSAVIVARKEKSPLGRRLLLRTGVSVLLALTIASLLLGRQLGYSASALDLLARILLRIVRPVVLLWVAVSAAGWCKLCPFRWGTVDWLNVLRGRRRSFRESAPLLAGAVLAASWMALELAERQPVWLGAVLMLGVALALAAELLISRGTWCGQLCPAGSFGTSVRQTLSCGSSACSLSERGNWQVQCILWAGLLAHMAVEAGAAAYAPLMGIPLCFVCFLTGISFFVRTLPRLWGENTSNVRRSALVAVAPLLVTGILAGCLRDGIGAFLGASVTARQGWWGSVVLVSMGLGVATHRVLSNRTCPSRSIQIGAAIVVVGVACALLSLCSKGIERANVPRPSSPVRGRAAALCAERPLGSISTIAASFRGCSSCSRHVDTESKGCPRSWPYRCCGSWVNS